MIALHGARELCWRFAHLHGFASATQAQIRVGAAGKSGNVFVALSTGPRLHHRGCVAIGATVIKGIEKHPSGYHVSIESVRYPRGAVARSYRSRIVVYGACPATRSWARVREASLIARRSS